MRYAANVRTAESDCHWAHSAMSTTRSISRNMTLTDDAAIAKLLPSNALIMMSVHAVIAIGQINPTANVPPPCLLMEMPQTISKAIVAVR